MKPEFLYHRKDGKDKVHAAGMSLVEMATEPAYIARRLYASFMRQDPLIAEHYRRMVIQAVTDPMTWDLTNAAKPEVEMCIIAPENGGK